jgi:hypothetical protein
MSCRSPYAVSPLWRLLRPLKIALGFALLGVGLLMVLLPGPAVVVIPLGLALLATEYHWARRLLGGIRARLRRVSKTPGR